MTRTVERPWMAVYGRRKFRKSEISRDRYREAVVPHSEGLAAASGLPWQFRSNITLPGTGCAGSVAFLPERHNPLRGWRPWAGNAVPG
jgi:hypothetical protein